MNKFLSIIFPFVGPIRTAIREELSGAAERIAQIVVQNLIAAKDAGKNEISDRIDALPTSQRMIISGFKAIAADYVDDNKTLAEKAAFVDRVLNASEEDIATWISGKVSGLG